MREDNQPWSLLQSFAATVALLFVSNNKFNARKMSMIARTSPENETLPFWKYVSIILTY